MSLFSIFKLPKHKEKITDEKVIHKQYTYWRFRIFTGIFIGYLFFYFTRYSFLVAKPILAAEQGFSIIHLGWLQTAFLCTISTAVILKSTCGP